MESSTFLVVHEAIITQLMCCHMTCTSESSADALMDTRIVYLCCLLLQISCWHQSSLTTSQLTILDGCWSKGTVVGIQRSERRRDCCCKQGTGEASAVSASMCRPQRTPAAHMWRPRAAAFRCFATSAWLHFRYWNVEKQRAEYTPTYIRCIYMQSSCCRNICIHICALTPRNRHTCRDAFKTLCHVLFFSF